MLKLKTWQAATYTGDGFAVQMEVKRLGFIEEKAFSVHMGRVRRDRVVKHMLIAQAEEVERKRKVLDRMNRFLVAGGHAAVVIGDDLDVAYKAAEERLAEAGIELPSLTPAELDDFLQQDEERVRARQEAMQEYWESLDPTWLRQVFKDYVRKVEGLEVDGEAVTTGEQLGEVADQPLTLFVLETIRGLAGLSGPEKKASSSPHISEPVAGPGASPVTSAVPADGTGLGTAPETPAASLSSV